MLTTPKITRQNIALNYKLMNEQDFYPHQNIFFAMSRANCEMPEILSPACELMENHEIKTKEEIDILYNRLKVYESDLESTRNIGPIRLKELILQHPETSIEVVEDISKGVLKESYLFKYYGGYDGEDYRITIDLIESVKKRLESSNKELCPNLQKYILENEIEEKERQMEMTDTYGEEDDDIIRELNSDLLALKIKLDSLKQLLLTPSQTISAFVSEKNFEQNKTIKTCLTK